MVRRAEEIELENKLDYGGAVVAVVAMDFHSPLLCLCCMLSLMLTFVMSLSDPISLSLEDGM